MGLKDVEPDFDLRFVEKVGAEERVTPIEKFPCVIGRLGDIAPQICNGAISGKHCTIGYDLATKIYTVVDGADGKPSVNHIYFGDGGDITEVDSAMLRKLGDRVYLMRTHTGNEAYLELACPTEKDGDPRSTQGLDPALVKTTAMAIEAHDLASANKAHIAVIEGKLGQFLAIAEVIGKHPRVYITAIFIVTLAAWFGLPLFMIYSNRDSIGDLVIDRLRQAEQRSK